jgi:RNA polymerase sigma factor (sigma-70 family)
MATIGLPVTVPMTGTGAGMARVIIMIQPIQSEFLTLLEQARQGDSFAWNELYRIYNPKIKRVIRNRLQSINNRVRDLYDTCDFSSELWQVLYSRLPALSINSETDLLSFMCKVAQDKINDATRRRMACKRNSSRTRSLDAVAADEPGGMDPPSHEPTPSKYAIAKELSHTIDSESRLMGDEISLIMQLKTQDYTNQEVSAKTGINLRKVQRGVSELRKRLMSV